PAPDLDLDLTLLSSHGAGGPVVLVVGDFSGDGKPDLAASYNGWNQYENQDKVGVFVNDGTGHFAAPQPVAVGIDPWSLTEVPRDPALDLGSFEVADHTPLAQNLEGEAI